GLVPPGERGPASAWTASTRGTGELILAAARTGAPVVLVAAGGSATTDGGAGAIAAIEEGGGLGGTQLVVLCDVRTPFEDAPRVFAPQKGADAATVDRLRERLDEQADGFGARDPRGVPMTGAAGGLAGGLWAAFGAHLEAGAPFVLDAVGFAGRLAAAGAVVLGEGRLDAQTLQGKILAEAAARAATAGVPCHAIVGQDAQDEPLVRARLGLAEVREAGTLAAIEAAAAALAQGSRT
ncbi:MAG: glycerate kinase, partial [Solirubrobacterales bacterium]|nr:glycerate kinase [Solirubrobacterales bacterium]